MKNQIIFLVINQMSSSQERQNMTAPALPRFLPDGITPTQKCHSISTQQGIKFIMENNSDEFLKELYDELSGSKHSAFTPIRIEKEEIEDCTELTLTNLEFEHIK